MGWEQAANLAPTQPSPAPCSIPVPESDSVQDLSPAYTVQDPAQLALPPATRAFLHIVRHGIGPAAIYVLT